MLALVVNVPVWLSRVIWSRATPCFAKYSSTHGMMRWFGVARVMSVKLTHTFASGVSHSRKGFAPMGLSSAASSAAFSSASAGLCAGSMTVVRVSGNSTGKWPWP